MEVQGGTDKTVWMRVGAAVWQSPVEHEKSFIIEDIHSRLNPLCRMDLGSS
jgi:hypothetical protein